MIVLVVAYRENDIFELTIGVYKSLKQAITKLELPEQTVYKNKRNNGIYKARGIILERIKES